MRTSRFTDEQIIGIVREYEAGAKLTELCRRHNVSPTTFYKWRAKYGGMAVSDAKRLRALEEENRRLKQLLAESMLDNQALKLGFAHQGGLQAMSMRRSSKSAGIVCISRPLGEDRKAIDVHSSLRTRARASLKVA